MVPNDSDFLVFGRACLEPILHTKLNDAITTLIDYFECIFASASAFTFLYSHSNTSKAPCADY